jgi:uncharacterized protein YutE (UPF0331/DUF86 family)
VVDRDVLRRKLAELAEYVTQVSEYRDITVERYRENWKTQRIVERTLQMAIEACINVARHVLADGACARRRRTQRRSRFSCKRA